MASKQPQRSNLKSDLKFMAQTTYATMFVWAFIFLDQMVERRKKKDNSPLLDLLGFAAGNKHACRVVDEKSMLANMQGPRTKCLPACRFDVPLLPRH